MPVHLYSTNDAAILTSKSVEFSLAYDPLYLDLTVFFFSFWNFLKINLNKLLKKLNPGPISLRVPMPNATTSSNSTNSHVCFIL